MKSGAVVAGVCVKGRGGGGHWAEVYLPLFRLNRIFSSVLCYFTVRSFCQLLWTSVSTSIVQFSRRDRRGRGPGGIVSGPILSLNCSIVASLGNFSVFLASVRPRVLPPNTHVGGWAGVGGVRT